MPSEARLLLMMLSLLDGKFVNCIDYMLMEGSAGSGLFRIFFMVQMYQKT
jgi:hypothetical protein